MLVCQMLVPSWILCLFLLRGIGMSKYVIRGCLKRENPQITTTGLNTQIINSNLDESGLRPFWETFRQICEIYQYVCVNVYLNISKYMYTYEHMIAYVYTLHFSF